MMGVRFTWALVLLAAGACSSEPTGGREEPGLDDDAGVLGADDLGVTGWMSSECSAPLSPEQLWQLVGSGRYDLYVVDGVNIVGDQEVQEQTGIGVLESRAQLVSLEDAEVALDVTQTSPTSAKLFIEESRVFRADWGTVYRERACAAAGSVEDGGSLSSRVLAGSDRRVLLVVEATVPLGAVVRQVAPVSGDTVHLADDQEVSLQELAHAAP